MTEAQIRRRLQLLEILADGAGLVVNGVPWREMVERVERGMDGKL